VHNSDNFTYIQHALQQTCSRAGQQGRAAAQELESTTTPVQVLELSYGYSECQVLGVIRYTKILLFFNAAET
jgi:hypothetical protein